MSTDGATPNGSLPAVLAIDGGNSKTDVALVAADGTVLATARGRGAPAQTVGVERSMQVLQGLVTEVSTLAGTPPGGPVAQHTAAFLAGADLPVEEERLQAVVAKAGWSASTTVANDTFAILRAGTDTGWGVAVVCGAGINCVGVAPDGAVARFPSLGQITGDWGGGWFLGQEVMWWAIRAEDGRGPETALREGVKAYFGTTSVADVAFAVHLGQMEPRRLHALTHVLFAASDVGDAVATDLVDRLAHEVVAMASVALRRLELLDAATTVVLGGGVLAARNPRLTAAIEEGLAAAAPRSVPLIVDVPPVVGAALAGLDHVGAEGGAHERLRAAYRSAAPNGSDAGVSSPAMRPM